MRIGSTTFRFALVTVAVAVCFAGDALGDEPDPGVALRRAASASLTPDERLTLARLLPTDRLPLGEYELKVITKDKVGGQIVENKGKFVIEK